MSDLPRRACWTREAARTVFRTEALEGDDAVFLATHTPIMGFEVSGKRASDIGGANERAVLDALAHANQKHAFCVVQGEPGSGKSHLIRWLYVNWPNNGRDKTLLLQRSDGSLEGALNQLQRRLGSEFASLFENLGKRHKAGDEGRAGVFHSMLCQTLRTNHYETPPEDIAWCEQWNPAALLFSERILTKWQAPRRILRLVSGKEGERNSETARFNVFDIVDLMDLVEAKEITSRKTQGLRWRLDAEVDGVIAPEREKGRSAEDIQRDFADSLPLSLEFVAALNRRLNDAIQDVIGISAAGLKGLFQEVRRRLAEKNIRLVLLLEDITSWQGLDDSLIDVLTTNAETREEDDLCDLVSVVGVTPDYYSTLQGNYRQRITHEIRLGNERDGLQDVVTLRDRDSRHRFVARYLAATRAGGEALQSWRQMARENPSVAPPNVCLDCPVRSGCHKTFGAVASVGLYPFTAGAVDAFYDALKDNDINMTWKTPRGLIQGVLSPTLDRPDLIDEGRYPSVELDRTIFTEESKRLSGAILELIDVRVDQPKDRERVRRLLAFWGARGRLATERQEDGELSFHNVRRGIFEAFALPWIGGDDANATEAAFARPSPPSVAVVADPPVAPPAASPGEPARRVDPAAGVPSPTIIRPGPEVRLAPATPKSGDRRPRLALKADDIRAWRETGTLPNPTEWNRAVHAIVQAIDPRRVDADPWVWERMLTEDLVKIQGTGRTGVSHFVVPATDWLRDGLEAHAILSGNPQHSAGEEEFYRRRVVRMMRNLAIEVSRFIERRLTRLSDGTRWSPIVSAAQVLLVRAWLRRAVLPTARTADQFVALLSDEDEAESAPKARTQSWQAYLDSTNKQHSELRKMLRKMLSTPQGDAKGFGLASGSAAHALVELIREFKFVGVPDPQPLLTVTPEVLGYTATLADKATQMLADLLAAETTLLSNRAARVTTLLRDRSPRDHAARVDAALSAASSLQPGAAADRVKAWKQAYEALQRHLADDTTRRELEDTLYQFSDDLDSLPTSGPERLGFLVKARANVLSQLVDALTTGETAVAAMHDHVGAIVAGSSTVEGLSTIHAKGRRLREAVGSLRDIVDQQEGIQ